MEIWFQKGYAETEINKKKKQGSFPRSKPLAYL